MWRGDPIVEEVRKAREAYAAQFDFDLDRIFEDIKKHEQEHPERLANFKAGRPHAQRVERDVPAR